MQIQMVEIGLIRPNPKNLRKHGAKQIGQIATSIVEFGFTTPLLVTEDYTLLAGHGRYEAAKKLVLSEVPVVLVAGLSPAKRQALAILDNKLAQNSTWDTVSLAAELPKLEKLLLDEGLKPAILGFEPLEIKHLHSVAKARETGARDTQNFGITDGAVPVAKRDDLFTFAGHTILCGDPCAPGAMQRLMKTRRADFVYIDSSIESLDHSDDSIPPDHISILHHMLSAATSVSRGGAINVFTTSNDARLTKKASRPRAQRYEAVNGAGDEAQRKPVKLLVALINATTRRGDLVLGISQDPSSFITAAERTGRPACVIAKQPNAVDVAIRRWQAVTGLKATHAESGLLFDVLAQTRSHENF